MSNFLFATQVTLGNESKFGLSNGCNCILSESRTTDWIPTVQMEINESDATNGANDVCGFFQG